MINFVKKHSYIFIVILIFIVSLFQTYSIFLNIDEKVDESELVYFSVGFFGGDLNPHWYGYGNIAMYFLSLMYFIAFPFKMLFSDIGSTDEYAMLLFSSDYFIDLGRYILSIIGVVSIFIYLIIIKKYSQSLLFTILLGVVFLTSYDSLYYSNYIRLDQFVAFFVALIIFFSLNLSKRNYYFLAISIGAAIAAKISALALCVMFLYATIVLIRQKEITYKDFIFSGLLLVFVIQGTQPYNNLYEFFLTVASQNSVESVSFLSKLTTLYTTVLSNILQNINNYLLYCLLFLPFTFRYYSKAVLVAITVFLLLLLPYLSGTGTTRNYWLIPNYDIVYFLIGLSIISFIKFVEQNKVIHFFISLLLSLFMILIIYSNLIDNFKFIERNDKNVMSNSRQAKSWIEENIILDGNNKIFLDTYKNYMLPKIYNKNSASESISIGGNFKYNRIQNKYLTNLFSQYLLTEYLEDTKAKYKTVLRLRIDPLTNIEKNISIKNIKLFHQQEIIDFEIVKTKDIENLQIEDNNIKFDSIGNDPYIILSPKKIITLDESFAIKFKVNKRSNDKIAVYYDTGTGFIKNDKTVVNNSEEIAISKIEYLFENSAFATVHPLRVTGITKEFQKEVSGSYFITSPNIYNQFMNKEEFTQGHRKYKVSKELQDHYQYLTSQRLYKRFDKGYGAVIEIYKID